MLFRKFRVETSNYTIIVSVTDNVEWNDMMQKRSEIKLYTELTPKSIDTTKLAYWIAEMFGDETLGIEIWESDVEAICLPPHLDKYNSDNSVMDKINEIIEQAKKKD